MVNALYLEYDWGNCGLVMLAKYALPSTVTVRLLDYGEEYVLTFPYIYVRSVTVSHSQTATLFQQSFLPSLILQGQSLLYPG